MENKTENDKTLVSKENTRAKEITAIADQLNQIRVPLTANVYSHGMRWTIRNIAFWEALKSKEKEFLKIMQIEQS